MKLRVDKDFEASLSCATGLKEEGNALVVGRVAMPTEGARAAHASMPPLPEDAQDIEGRFMEAVNKYERALSLFHWFRPLREDWRKQDIDDTTMAAEHYEPANALERDQIRSLRISCLSNLSHCYLKLREWSSCVQACGVVLELDAGNVKALFRRAQARTLPASAGGVEQTLALADLKRAMELTPSNVEVRAARSTLVRAMDLQRQRDQKTRGFLGRPEREAVVKEGTESSSANAGKEHVATLSGSSGRGGGGVPNLTMQDVLIAAKDMDAAADRKEREGDVVGAASLRHRAQSSRETVESHMSAQAGSRGAGVGAPPLGGLEDVPDWVEEGDKKRAHRLISAMREEALAHEAQQGGKGAKNASLGAADSEALFKKASYRIAKEDALPRAQRLLGGAGLQEQVAMLRARLACIDNDSGSGSGSGSDGGSGRRSVGADIIAAGKALVRAADGADPVLEGLEDVLCDMLCCDMADMDASQHEADPLQHGGDGGGGGGVDMTHAQAEALLARYGHVSPPSKGVFWVFHYLGLRGVLFFTLTAILLGFWTGMLGVERRPIEGIGHGGGFGTHGDVLLPEVDDEFALPGEDL